MALRSGQWMRIHAAAHPPGALPRRSIGRLPAQCPASHSYKPYFGLDASHTHVKCSQLVGASRLCRAGRRM